MASVYKAFFIDLDGTLAQPFLYISPRVEEAVKKVDDEVMVTIVSSRDHTVVADIAGSLGLNSLQVSEGGARIFNPNTGEAPWLCIIDREDVHRILWFLERNAIAFSAVDAENPNVEALNDVAQWRVTRITAFGLTPSHAHDISERFGQLSGVHASIVEHGESHAWMVDFTHSMATKGSAVVRYAELIGIEPSQIIGAGDSYNDLSLLKACGMRIAMGNAAPEVKAIADYIAPTIDEDGLAVAIEDFVLPMIQHCPSNQFQPEAKSD